MRKLSIVSVFVILTVSILSAQSSQQQVPSNNAPDTTNATAVVVLEPEWSKVPYLLTDSLVPLERQQYVLKAGFRETAYVFGGVASPVRVPASATFVIKLENGDPSAQIFIDKMSVDKKNRKAVALKEGLRGTTTQTSGVIPLGFKKYGTSVKVMPLSPLAEGEYLVSVVSSSGELSCYLFGVDSNK